MRTGRCSGISCSRAPCSWVSLAMLEPNGAVVEKIEVKPLEGVPQPSAADLDDPNSTDALCLFPRTGNIFRSMLTLEAHGGRVSTWRVRSIPVLSSSRWPRRPAWPSWRPRAEEGRHPGRLRVDVHAIALIVLLSAIWFGLNFANRLVAPVRRLIHATDQGKTAISMSRFR